MRFAMLMLAALQVAAGDMSGKWTIGGDVQGNAVNLNCLVQQTAQAQIGGTCEVNGMAAVEIAGGLKDTEFKFSFTVAGYTLTYTGTIQGDTMEGNIEVAGASGMFTGKRVKE